MLVIGGEREQAKEVVNTEDNKKWDLAGVYDQESGLFYIREGEHTCLQKHFKSFRDNRQMQKKALKNYAHKTAAEQPSFKPQVNSKSEQISKQRRQKLFKEGNVDVVTILLHPNNVYGNVGRMQQIAKAKEQKELSEVTFKPQTNKELNDKMLSHKEEEGDRAT